MLLEFGAVELGELHCVVGVVSVAELFVHPMRRGPAIVALAHALLQQPGVTVAEAGEAVARRAAGLLARGPVRRLADALVAAAAADLGLPLVTADRRLARSGVVEALLVQDFA
jgi:predicted nucleic acid-binding protein